MPKYASREDIRNWIVKCHDQKCQFLIVAKDAFTKEEYPLYCRLPKECAQALNSLSGMNNMDTAVKVINLAMSTTAQLDAKKPWNPPEDWKKLL